MSLLTVPYVSPAEFRAAPTFTNSRNLRAGQGAAAQDAELFNVLLRASAWADNFVSAGGFMSHTTSEQCRATPDRSGRLRLNPSDIPVTAVIQLSYGVAPGSLTTLDSPTAWVEDGRQAIVELSGAGAWSGSLQFGPPVGREVFVRWTYRAGYAHTYLAAAAAAGASSIRVADATGIAVGTVLRLWDPGAEEAVTVGAGYTAGSTTIPLAAPLTNAHDVTDGPMGLIGVSELPPDVHLAVINVGTALLMRPDSLAEDEFRGAPTTTSTRDADPRAEGGGLILEAKRILRSYRRAR